MIPIVKFADLPNGLRLPYVEQGDPGGTPLLLLHGYTDSCRSYLPLLACLPGEFRIIAVTQRGHGDAGRPGAGYRTADFAADLALFTDALQLGSAVLVGHSMGSQIAQRFAIDHPSRVRGLVLIGAFTTLRGNPAAGELWNIVSELRDPVDPGFVREFQRGTLARPAPAAFLDMVVAESLKVPARVWCDALAGMLMHDVAPELGLIKAPTLILWGDQDSLCARSTQDALATAIPGARFAAYQGAGHAPHWEDPARVAADVAGFAVNLATTAQTARRAPFRARRRSSASAAPERPSPRNPPQ